MYVIKVYHTPLGDKGPEDNYTCMQVLYIPPPSHPPDPLTYMVPVDPLNMPSSLCILTISAYFANTCKGNETITTLITIN